MLVLAFAASAATNLLGGNHAAFAASNSHQPMSHTATDGPFCLHADGQAHGTIYSIDSGCSFYVLVSGTAAFTLLGTTPAEMQPDTAHSGKVVIPHFRPPELFLNI